MTATHWNPLIGELMRGVRTAWGATRHGDYGRKSSEQANAQFRQSLYFVKDLKAGDVITADAVKSIRPGFGLAPKHLDAILGRVMTCDVARATAVKWEQFK